MGPSWVLSAGHASLSRGRAVFNSEEELCCSTRPSEMSVGEVQVEGLMDNGKAEPRMRQYQGTGYEVGTADGVEVGEDLWLGTGANKYLRVFHPY